MILCIDATSNGSGGARRHLSEILNVLIDSNINYFNKIIVWGPDVLLKILPTHDIIEKKSARLLNKGLLGIILWQILYRDKEFSKAGDIFFSPFGNYIGNNRPYVSMSRNMLMFERNERKKFGFGYYRLKLKLGSIVNKISLKNSSAIIFISNYARKSISKQINIDNKNIKTIYHGISPEFKKKPIKQKKLIKYSFDKPFKLLYVSNILPYKYHFNLVSTIIKLRKKNLPISLTLVGKIDHKKSGFALNKIINNNSDNTSYIKWHQNVSLNSVKSFYHESDAFIYASSCENMPNILIEAMSSGLPIICSNKGPMKEFLKNGGLYFDPTDKKDLEYKLEFFIKNPNLREKLQRTSFELSKKYSWQRCANETADFLKSIN